MNPFEQAARARKVSALLALIPAGNGQALAARLSAFTQGMRNVWAKRAGCNPPSEATWSQLCEAVRGRDEVRRSA